MKNRKKIARKLSSQSVPFLLKNSKEFHPVELAEYTNARDITSEPTFTWRVPYTLRKRDIILSAAKSRLSKTTQKYSIEIPDSISHVQKIDTKNGNYLWCETIELEMQNNGVAF